MGGGIDSCGATPFFPLGTPKQRNPRALRHRIPIWSRAFLKSRNNLFTQIFLKGFKRVVLQCWMSLDSRDFISYNVKKLKGIAPRGAREARRSFHLDRTWVTVVGWGFANGRAGPLTYILPNNRSWPYCW